MTRVFRGADALADTLCCLGARRLFTLSGNQIMSVFDATCDRDLDLVHVRHEAAAVHMADGWGRLTGQPGVALVTAGPGFANCLSALYVALMAESPLLLLSGAAPAHRQHPLPFQAMPQAQMAATVTKASRSVIAVENIAAEVQQAWQLACSGRPGPVHLSLPVDVLEAASAAEGDEPPPVETAAARGLPAADLQAILELLSAGQRPLILAGPAAGRHDSAALLEAFSARTGIPWLVSESPRGAKDPSLGAFAWVLAKTDVLLLLGKRADFSLQRDGQWAVSADCRVLQIDPDPALRLSVCDMAPPPDRLARSVTAACQPALRQLVDAASHITPQDSAWSQAVRAAVSYIPPEWAAIQSAAGESLKSIEVCRAVQQHLQQAEHSLLIADGGEFGQWAQACIRADRRLINGASGSIGSAIPLALAGRLAAPETSIFALLGDGTFGFHASEFDTAVRYNLPFVAVIGNDACWNAEHQIQLRKYGPERTTGCRLFPTRYDQVVRGLGGHGELVTRREDLAGALARAEASAQPACVNVAICGDPAPDLSDVQIGDPSTLAPS